MKHTRMISLLAVLALAILSVAAVSAQGGRGNRGNGGEGRFSEIIELTGLDAEALQAARETGQSLAEAIEANGGNVAAVETALIDLFSQRPDADAATVAERVDRFLNTPMNDREGRFGERRGHRSEIFSIISEATGLDAEALRTAVDSGQSLAELISANGGDVAAVETALIDLFSQRPDADAATVAEKVDQFLNTPLNERPQRPNRPATDLEAQS